MNSKRNRGISLLEVLVSLAVLSTALFAYMELQAKSLHWLHDSQQQYTRHIEEQNAQE